MTISTTTNQATATGDGSSVAFPFPGPFIVPADLKVYLAGVLQTAGYTVTGSIDVGGSGAYSSGTITFAAAPAVGVQVLIYCDPDLLQSTSFPPNNPFPAKTMEKAVDKLTLQVQRVKGAQTASLFFPAGDSTSGQLPAKAARLNTISGFDANGAPTAIPFGLGNFTGTVSSSALREKQTATAAQTAFALASIAVAIGAVQVFVDGFELPASDITVNSPTSVTIASPLRAGQQVEFVTNTFSTFGSGKATLAHTSTSSTDFGSFVISRTVSLPGGTFGYVNSAIRADTFVLNSGVTSFEWTATFVMHNYAAAGENVAMYAQGIKYSTGPTWGATIEVIDNTGANPTTGAVSLELDMNGNGTDNNNARVCLDIAIRRPNGTGTAMEAAYGIRFQNSFDASTKLKTAIGFYPGMSVGIGLDFSAATVQGACVNLAQNQAIQFNSTAIAASSRLLYYNGGGYVFANTAGTSYWALNDDGSLTAKGVQLLGARQTITGSRATDAWRQSLMAALAAHGLVTDSTTA